MATLPRTMNESSGVTPKETKKKRSVGSIVREVIVDVLIAIFVLFAVLNIYLAIATKRNNAANLFGKQARLVLTGSMSPTIPTNSLVLVDTSGDHKNYEVGDVLTFKYDPYGSLPTTHRVIAKETKDSGIVYYTLKGDNPSATATQHVPYTDVIGKVTFHSLWMGKVVTFSKGIGGWICFVLVPCGLVIGYETYHIVKIVKSSKNEKEPVPESAVPDKPVEQTQEERNQELEELRKRVAELEKQNRQENETKPDKPSEK